MKPWWTIWVVNSRSMITSAWTKPAAGSPNLNWVWPATLVGVSPSLPMERVRVWAAQHAAIEQAGQTDVGAVKRSSGDFVHAVRPQWPRADSLILRSGCYFISGCDHRRLRLLTLAVGSWAF